MQNNYWDDSPADAVLLAEQMSTTINAALATYGVTAGQITALNSAVTAMESALTDQESARAMYRAATDTRNDARRALSLAIADVAATVYAKETLSNSEIAATGLAVHDSGPSFTSPVEVYDLNANPFANGTVQLSWNRNNNPTGTSFLVETSGDGETWNTAALTTKSKITLSGFAPGEVKYFRVVASKSEQYAAPSNIAAIYLVAPSAPAYLLAA